MRVATAVGLVALLASPVNVAAAQWQVVYQTDFSSDPNWTTNASDRYYWSSETQDYSVKQVDAQLGGYYGVHDVGVNSGSFRITYDIEPLSFDYGGGSVNFGLWGADLESYDGGNFVRLAFVNDYSGGLHLQVDADNGPIGHPATNDWQHFSLSTWYRVQLTYDASIGTLLANTTVRDTGGVFCTMSLSNVGPFSSDMTRLGSSCISNHWREGYPGMQGIANIDNVVFEIPEPITLSLLTFGGLAMLRYRRRVF